MNYTFGPSGMSDFSLPWLPGLDVFWIAAVWIITAIIYISFAVAVLHDSHRMLHAPASRNLPGWWHHVGDSHIDRWHFYCWYLLAGSSLDAQTAISTGDKQPLITGHVA
jgi:hypothetical protein